MMDEKDRVVALSGATGGLGRVVTQAFAKNGAKLALFGRTLDKLQSLAEEFDLPSDRVLPHAVDVGDPTQAKQAAQAVVDKFGRIDVYLHLVGGWIGGKPLVEVEEAEMQSMLQQHLWSIFSMTQAVVPPMLENHWGRVIAISSPTAQRPPGNNSPYAAAKAAEESLILSLAQELQGTGVTANIITVKMIDVKHERLKNPSEKNRSWTQPEEIAAAILHLCTEEAAMINGARLPMYGGI
jgi:NAD(P)-dependent dehydrogenase (short-subunit alcohol dehydrogenase family)